MALGAVQDSFFEAARLEILRFVPPPLLQHVDFERFTMEELTALLAKARYLEELEVYLHARAIAAVLGEEADG